MIAEAILVRIVMLGEKAVGKKARSSCCGASLLEGSLTNKAFVYRSLSSLRERRVLYPG
jgi:hypothetical protein